MTGRETLITLLIPDDIAVDLATHGVLLHYGPADLDHDRQAGNALSGFPG